MAVPLAREQCFGRYEGTPRDGAEFRISKTHFADRYGDGESMMQLAQRIYNLLDELRQDEDKTYLLVAHNGIARVVESYFHDMTNEDYAAAGIKKLRDGGISVRITAKGRREAPGGLSFQHYALR